MGVGTSRDDAIGRENRTYTLDNFHAAFIYAFAFSIADLLRAMFAVPRASASNLGEARLSFASECGISFILLVIVAVLYNVRDNHMRYIRHCQLIIDRRKSKSSTKTAA